MFGRFPRLGLLGTLWLAWVWWAAPLSAADSIALADYWQTLAETQQLVEQIASQPPTTTANPELVAAAARWQAIRAVTLPDGTVVTVDHSFLAAQLRANPPDLKQLSGLLETLHAAQADWPSPQFSADALPSLARILAEPEFQYRESPPPAWLEWLIEQWRRFLNWLDNLLPSSSPGAEGGPVSIPEQIATFVFMLLLAGLLAYALRGILADFARESMLPNDEEFGGEPLTADSALHRAQELSGGGDYRTAVRYLYLSTLLRLEERGLLRYDRSLTNREVLKRVAHDPTLATVLRDVVDVFDRVWYGYQPLSSTDYGHYAATVEALKNRR